MRLSIQDMTDSVSRLDEILKPIANRPIDINDPSWINKVAAAPDPLDQAGVRAEAQAALMELLDAYESGSDELRREIRELLRKYSSFTWAARVKAPMTTADGFRKHLLRLSAADKVADLRDTIVSVQALCERARSAGVEVAPILAEVAAMSSDESTGAMGSMRSVLLAAR